jgi:Na+/phosphate symporter
MYFLMPYMPILMLIGQVIQTTSLPQVPILFILAAILSLGAPKSKKSLHALQLRQDIGQLPTPLLNSIGYPHCYMILASRYQPVQSFTMTMLGLLSCVPILFFTPELSMLLSTSTSYVIKYKKALSVLLTYPPLIN